MSTQSWTPGEWTVRKPVECDDPHVTHWIDAADGVPVADIKVNGHSAGNARLIAAAPAMAEALYRIVTELTQHRDHGLKGSPVFYALAEARAALAKAGVL